MATDPLSAFAHCARALARLARDYDRMAERFPRRQFYLDQAADLRHRSRDYLRLARQEKDWRDSMPVKVREAA